MCFIYASLAGLGTHLWRPSSGQNLEIMLESYITPLLMSYVDKYIKNLKPSDLSLSLWGGDVILYNLELRLDVLEKVRVISEIVISMTACVRWSFYC